MTTCSILQETCTPLGRWASFRRSPGAVSPRTSITNLQSWRGRDPCASHVTNERHLPHSHAVAYSFGVTFICACVRAASAPSRVGQLSSVPDGSTGVSNRMSQMYWLFMTELDGITRLRATSKSVPHTEEECGRDVCGSALTNPCYSCLEGLAIV